MAYTVREMIMALIECDLDETVTVDTKFIQQIEVSSVKQHSSGVGIETELDVSDLDLRLGKKP